MEINRECKILLLYPQFSAFLSNDQTLKHCKITSWLHLILCYLWQHPVVKICMMKMEKSSLHVYPEPGSHLPSWPVTYW